MHDIEKTLLSPDPDMLRSRPLAGDGPCEVGGSCFKLLVVASLGLVQKCNKERNGPTS